MNLLLWILLTLLLFMIGFGILSVFYRKVKAYQITFSESYLLGMICCIGLAEVVHVVSMGLNESLQKAGIVFVGMLVIASLTAVVAVLFAKTGKRIIPADVRGKTGWVWATAFGTLLLCQILMIFGKENIVTSGDITLETVQSFLELDGIYRVMPLTGMPNESGMPLRYTILCLPTLYAMLCRTFSVEAEYLVTKMIPVLVLCAAYFAYYRLSSTLFGEEQYRDRFIFLVIVACIFMFSDRAAYMDGYSVLYSGYMGVSIRNLVLIPYTFSAALEKRWWKAVLCILAEACITWTFWGCGVCLIITLGIVLLTIMDTKCPFLHRFMQFFRKKEELL